MLDKVFFSKKKETPTVLAAIDLQAHGNLLPPPDGVDAEIPGNNLRLEPRHHDGVAVVVAVERLGLVVKRFSVVS